MIIVPLSGKLELSKPSVMSLGLDWVTWPLLQGILGTKCLAEDMTAAGCMEFWEREYLYPRTALLIASRDWGSD